MLTQNQPNQERKILGGKKKLHWFVALSTLPLLGVVTAFGLVPQNDFDFSAASSAFLEKVILEKPIATPPVKTTGYWRSERSLRSDTVETLLTRLNIKDAAANHYLGQAADFRTLPSGTEVRAETTAAGSLIKLRYTDSDDAQVLIEKQNESFMISKLPAQLEKRIFVRTAKIESSLYAAADKAGLPNATANQLNELFSGDIDFHHDLRKGDQFTVIYEMLYSNGTFIKPGLIQAAEFINQGQTYHTVYFQNDDGHGDYYTPEGKSIRKAFLRSPIKFSRISSRFSNSRFHPILKKWRSHKGVDFAAAKGTKVSATADGVVAFVGKKGGYGNVIILRHQSSYSTVYGHLSRFAKGLRSGQRVSQGDVIGYVGMTGLATGPHLHYEFREHGRQRDPLKIVLPDARPLDSKYLAVFRPQAEELLSQLNLLRNTNLALLD